MASRRIVVAMAATLATLTLAGLLIADLRTPRTPAEAVVALAELTLLACLIWLWAVCLAVVHEAGGRRPGRLAARAPARLRRVVLLACGVALTSALSTGLALPAPADAPGGGDQAAHPVAASGEVGDLDGLPYPRLPATPESAPLPPAANPTAHQAAHPAAPPPTRSTAPSTSLVLVRPGDSLWSITAALLEAGSGRAADDAAIAAAWPRLHRANRHAVPDPDLLRVGQRLRVPHDLLATASAAAHHRPLHSSPLGRTRP